MKKLVLILGIVALMFLGSCGVRTSSNINIDGKDLKYFKDDRTGLCFAIVASRKSFKVSATGLGLTCVPCENVEHLIK